MVWRRNKIRWERKDENHEKKSEDDFDYVGIFQKEFDDIEESLETFRAKIYFRSKVESIERIPVTGRMMNFKDSTEISNS